MIESSKRMGHQIEVNRLCAGAVLQQLALVASATKKLQLLVLTEEFLPAVRFNLKTRQTALALVVNLSNQPRESGQFFGDLSEDFGKNPYIIAETSYWKVKNKENSVNV